jgi:glycosyltransferase involved in cell wall biosynthesis
VSPRFSVVIPCYNQGAFLGEALDSLRAQTLPPHEVIVVDDGSTDPWSAERIRELCRPPIVLLSQPNAGPGAARNAAIRRSTGDWILPLDADDLLTPDALERYAEAIARAPEVDVWYPDIEHFGAEHDVWGAPHFNAWRLLWGNQMVVSAAIRRAVFDAGVSYNERMRAEYEDWELYVHACCERGFLARALERPVFRYRRWGYGMLSHADARRREIHAKLQAERPVYRDEARLLALKRRWSPFFSVAAAGPGLAAALERQRFRDWRVADEGGRVLRDGDLAAFRGTLGRSLLVSCDDAALARCLDADPYLLEKLAAAIEAASPPVAWLVTAAAGDAYPGFPAHGLPLEGLPCVAFAITTRFTFDPPGVRRVGPSLADDVARHFHAVAPGAQAAVIAGVRGPADAFALPDEARRALAAGAPPPGWRLAASERARFLREAASRLAKVAVGPDRFARLERSAPYRLARSLARGERPGAPAPAGAPTPPSLPPGLRAGPLEVERLGSRGYRETAWGIAEEPARHVARGDGDGPGLLVVAPWIIHGGADRAILDLLRGISAVAPHVRRYLVTTERMRMQWADQALPHLRGAFALAGPAETHSAQLCAWIERLGVDSVLVVSSRAGFDALPDLRRLPRRVRVAAQFHGFDRDPESGALVGWPVYAASRYNNLVDEYAVISGFVAERLTEALYVSPTKVRVVHLGIDAARFAAARRERLASAPARVLWLGRLAREKDPELAVRVAAAWKARHGSGRLRFTIAGGGPLEREVRALVRSLRVGDVVELTGPVDDPVPLYRDADAVLLTSRYEGIPVVVYEAMAAGLPVVTVHEHTSIPEVLPRERAWYVDDRADAGAYVAQLEALLADPARARAVAERNAAGSARHDLPRYAREMLEVIFPGLAGAGELAGGRRAADGARADP